MKSNSQLFIAYNNNRNEKKEYGKIYHDALIANFYLVLKFKWCYSREHTGTVIRLKNIYIFRDYIF